MADEQPREVLEDRVAALESSRRESSITPVLRDLIRYGGYVAIAWAIAWGAQPFAGRSTAADIHLDASVSVGIPWWVWGIIGGQFVLIVGLSFAWRRSERLRYDTVEQVTRFKAETEQMLDPGRQTSGLTNRGTTPTEGDQP